jgi:hypothetical protein
MKPDLLRRSGSQYAVLSTERCASRCPGAGRPGRAVPAPGVDAAGCSTSATGASTARARGSRTHDAAPRQSFQHVDVRPYGHPGTDMTFEKNSLETKANRSLSMGKASLAYCDGASDREVGYG